MTLKNGGFFKTYQPFVDFFESAIFGKRNSVWWKIRNWINWTSIKPNRTSIECNQIPIEHVFESIVLNFFSFDWHSIDSLIESYRLIEFNCR